MTAGRSLHDTLYIYFPAKLRIAFVSIACTAITLHVGWIVVERAQHRARVSDALHEVLHQPIEHLDLIEIQSVVSGFSAANQGAAICVRLPGNEVIRAGSGECNWDTLRHFSTRLKRIQYDIAVAPPFNSWVAVLGAALLIPLGIVMYIFLRFARRTLDLIRTDLSRLANDEMSTSWIFSEFEHLGSVLSSQRQQLAGAARAEAVCRMTQMMAHDVRKPFSLLRMGLTMLGNAKDPESVKKVLGCLMPEIDKAVRSVDGLIADVMEIGSSSPNLIQEPVSPPGVIESCLKDAFRMHPKSQISISYSLTHKHMVNVDAQKIGRVFSNIIGNAIQAMGSHGELWFSTRELGGMVEFCVGNSGSFIPAENLPMLFEAFFTSGKKGGTGLGLAIAQKIVTAHSGRIRCESIKSEEYPEGKVEFFFSLPVAQDRACQATVQLPQHSAEIADALSLAMQPEAIPSIDKGELGLEADIVQASARLGRPLKVLIVDDESVYRSALATYLSRTDEMRSAIRVVAATDASHGEQFAQTETFDLIITDVDMGRDSACGFELVRELRKIGVPSLICIHSNRMVATDHKEAYETGADAFLPKPMARAQLYRLLLQATKKAKGHGGLPAAGEPQGVRAAQIVY